LVDPADVEPADPPDPAAPVEPVEALPPSAPPVGPDSAFFGLVVLVSEPARESVR
jgi:hypothetical protein